MESVGPEEHRLRIAIDGPAGAGKSTVARQVAEALGYTYVDTGAMYRAVAWAIRQREIDPTDHHAVSALANSLDIRLHAPAPGDPFTHVTVDGEELTSELRTPEVSRLTSPVSAIPGVRRRMVELQKRMADEGGVVMEGHDIGTVVMPDAEVKVYLTASTDERARRRRLELAGRGVSMAHDEIKRDIVERDTRDTGRAVDPLVPAADAVHLVSDGLGAGEVVQQILALHQEVLNRGGR